LDAGLDGKFEAKILVSVSMIWCRLTALDCGPKNIDVWTERATTMAVGGPAIASDTYNEDALPALPFRTAPNVTAQPWSPVWA